MVEKSSLKEKKQKTAQIIKASLLPRLREQADQAILKDFVFDIMRMLKENNGKSILHLIFVLALDISSSHWRFFCFF